MDHADEEEGDEEIEDLEDEGVDLEEQARYSSHVRI